MRNKLYNVAVICSILLCHCQGNKSNPDAINVGMLTLTAGSNGTLSTNYEGCDSSSSPCSIPEGTEVVITATPDSGHRISSWGNACSSIVKSTNTCTLTIDTDKTASVAFEIIPSTTYMLTLTAESDGTLSTNYEGCDASSSPCSIPEGTEVILTANPDSTYRISSWGGACSSIVKSTNTCTLTIDTDKTVSVDFEIILIPSTTYMLTLTAGSNGTLSTNLASCDSSSSPCSIPEGTEVVITANPDSTYRISSWGNACSSIGKSTNTCTLTIDTDKTASVDFEIIPSTTYMLTLTAGSNGTLSTNYTGCDASSSPCSIPEGTEVVITANPNPTYRISSWGGACSSIGRSTSTCTLTMDTDKTASVAFEIIPSTTYMLTLTAGSNGTLSTNYEGCDASSSPCSIPEGTEVIITATPDSTYRISSWENACLIVDRSMNTCTLTIDTDKTVSVGFEIIPPTTYMLTLIAETDGSLNTNYEGCNVSSEETKICFIPEGTVVIITATPNDSSYKIHLWAGACVHLNPEEGTEVTTTCTLTINENTIVIASFQYE